ncbi:hypothetical protein HBH42_011310 [Parastagonospora nodorum]|nr:hypothetical protein HBH42_011310 [Parastagonospora nodorum]
MCAKNDFVRRKGLLLTSMQTRLAGELAIAESITAKDSNYVDTFSLDFAFSFANILSLIAFIISYRLFADKLVYALNRAIVMLIIILVNKTQLLLILGDVVAWLVYIIIRNLTLLARFIPITKIRDLLLKTLENAAKSRILLVCADGRIRQCYLTICAILKHYNFNIYVSLAMDILHLLLKDLVMKMLDFMQDMLDDIYPSKQKAIIQQLVAVVSLLFVLKAPFALHFIRAVCDLVILAALDSICTRANSEAYYITIVKQFYSIINKKDEVAVNIAISNFIYAAAVFIHIDLSWQSSSKRHNDPEHCNEEVLYLILIIIDYTCYDKDGKHIAYIRAFSEVLLFNNNRQIDNTTRILSVPFKFYDLSTIIRLVHLVLRDLLNLITRTTMSYYVNNYIN